MIRALLLLAILVCTAMTTEAAVTVEKIEYKGWPNCYRVSNGKVEVVATGDVGPRIMRFAFVGGQNFFREFPEQLGLTGESAFQFRGGDRVWRAPEDLKITWAPDNAPVNIEKVPNGLIARAPVEPSTGLQKEIEVRMEPSGAEVTVIHRIANHSSSALEFAPWVLTMMSPGGTAVSGFPPRGKHPQDLAPTNPLVMWAYTDLSDPRWKFTKKYLVLRQDPTRTEAQKLGMFNRDTWAAYVLNGQAFVKRSTADPSQVYPDFGSSFEMFTNQDFLELETLGPLSKVAAGGSVEQIEHWALIEDIRLSQWSDEEIDRVLLPRIKNLGSAQ
ncbi:MAG TPA: hypothetical protein VGL89_03370 [Candidatus Koribacter sp.]|jgi:hypothetical protein